MVRTQAVLQLLARRCVSVMLVGPPGCGKSTTVQHWLRSLSVEQFITMSVRFSAKTDASHAREQIQVPSRAALPRSWLTVSSLV
jgi:replication-associated recombination protein RarA